MRLWSTRALTGVAPERMWQLMGGVDAWLASGARLEPPVTRRAAVATDLAGLLTDSGLGHLTAALEGQTLDACQDAVLAGRPAFLSKLKECGVASLSDRQKVCNLLAKSAKSRAALS